MLKSISMPGFTTVLDMDSRGGSNTVDLRDAINRGILQGPRIEGSRANPSTMRAGQLLPEL